MARSVKEYQIPVSSAHTWYTLSIAGILAPRRAFGLTANSLSVILWACECIGHTSYARQFMLIETDYTIPLYSEYVGTSERTPAGIYWHVFEFHEP